jgi:hypothetical protein
VLEVPRILHPASHELVDLVQRDIELVAQHHRPIGALPLLGERHPVIHFVELCHETSGRSARTVGITGCSLPTERPMWLERRLYGVQRRSNQIELGN